MARPLRSEPRTERSSLALLVLAVLTLLLAVAVPLAPVAAEQPVVTWPRAGEAPVSTVLPLSPYRPLGLDATVPCSALRAGGTALRTLPADVRPHQGLVVGATTGTVTVAASGSVVLTEPLPAGACTYRIVADESGVRVDRDGAAVARAPVLPPQVAQLATDAEDAAAAGLSVTLRTDDRYASSPTAVKTALLAAHLLALLATLVLAVRRWRGTGDGLRRPKLTAADGAVLAVTLAWAVLGPLNYDDAWYASMARNAGEAGYPGNYIYMFNATESPFVASQYVTAAWGELGGWSLLWLRVLPVAYGLGTWVLLRVLLETVLGRVRAVPWLLLVAHLVWWLPYGLTLRPEPVIVLCSAAVLVLAELARRRRSIGVLAAATALAALAVAASPSGLVAAAPLVLAVPWLARRLAGQGWVARAAAVAVAAAALTVVVPIGFADATLGDVLDATAVHDWYYATGSWYREYLHYNLLLRINDTGTWGRRAPVLLTLAVLLVVVIGSRRRFPAGDPVRRLLLTAAVTSAVALLLLAPTPTKWVNHFGAVAAAPTVLLAAALLRSPLPRGAGVVASTAAALVVAGTAALVFAGPNIWRPYSDWGQPFGDHRILQGTFDARELAPHLGPLYLRNPVLWAALAIALVVALRAGRRSLTADRALLLVTSAGVVALMLLVFVAAPVRQYPGWSVALNNVRALAGQPCGLAQAVQVLRPSDAALGAPIGATARTGAFTGDVPPPVTGAAWHTAGTSERGALRTPWYPLPPDAPADLVVPVAGGRLAEQRVTVEVSTGPVTVPAAVVELAPDPGASPATWQDVHVALDEVTAAPVRAVRVVAEDRVPDPDGWLAVGQPVLAQWQPVTTLTRGEPVFADQLSAPLWPCVDQVAVAHGIAEAPTVRLAAAGGIWPPILTNSTFLDWGGTFVGADRTATQRQLASRLHPAPGAPMLPWGQVQQVVYDHPVGLVDLHVQQQVRAGWTRGPTLATEAYSGRSYRG